MMGTPGIRMRDDGGTLRTITRIRARDDGGTLRTITRVRVRGPDNVLRTVFDPAGTSTFAVTIDRSGVSGTGSGSGTITTSPAVTATATGGTAPYTYAWTLFFQTHPDTAPTANSPATASTTFTQTNVEPTGMYEAVFTVTATDSATPANTATDTVNANFIDLT